MRSAPVMVNLSCQVVKNENHLGDEPLGEPMEGFHVGGSLGVPMDDCLVDRPLGGLWTIVLLMGLWWHLWRVILLMNLWRTVLLMGLWWCLWRTVLLRLIEVETLLKFHNLGFWSVWKDKVSWDNIHCFLLSDGTQCDQHLHASSVLPSLSWWKVPWIVYFITQEKSRMSLERKTKAQFICPVSNKKIANYKLVNSTCQILGWRGGLCCLDG